MPRIIDFQANQFTSTDLAGELASIENWLDYIGGLINSGEKIQLEIEYSHQYLKRVGVCGAVGTIGAGVTTT